MKISQEVREFALAQNDAGQSLSEAEADAGMAEMSDKFRDLGGKVYVEADKVGKPAAE